MNKVLKLNKLVPFMKYEHLKKMLFNIKLVPVLDKLWWSNPRLAGHMRSSKLYIY
jgi:hypothetical protein